VGAEREEGKEAGGEDEHRKEHPAANALLDREPDDGGDGTERRAVHPVSPRTASR
jgi:hypothetical protein